MDTSVYTHLCRAGHAEVIAQLAPGGAVLIPADVDSEIERARELYPGVPAVSSVDWAQIVVLDEEEIWTQLQVKAQLGGGPVEHLGECAVIACAHRRGLTAIMDDRAAIAQAARLGVPCRDTLGIVVEAFRSLFRQDRARVARVVDNMVATGMYLPIDSGASLVAWAYEEGLLP